jgi:hypothetical protein
VTASKSLDDAASRLAAAAKALESGTGAWHDRKDRLGLLTDQVLDLSLQLGMLQKEVQLVDPERPDPSAAASTQAQTPPTPSEQS